jgi:hypothetical protein
MIAHPLLQHPMSALFTRDQARSRRASSWDRSGGNRDFIFVAPRDTAVLMEQHGPGCITHFYCALVFPDPRDYRDAILRCYWDGEEAPSVEVPLGDFFCLSHARVRRFTSALVSITPGFGASHGLNAYFPMPFATAARVTLENRGDRALGGLLPAVWYHIDYETYDAPPPDDTLRFHAHWHCERPTVAVGPQPNIQLHDASNLDGAENYVALDATGAGKMVGLHLQIHNIAGGWYGEGDDMVFIDGEVWPPSIHGTGTEEIFGGGACPAEEYAGTYHGFHLIESRDYSGLIGAYRWFVRDPIRFETSLRWTVEHGHANNFANEYASVAYWYQSEPHAPFPALAARATVSPPLPAIFESAREAFFTALARAMSDPAGADFRRLVQIGESFYAGRYQETLARLANHHLEG